MTCRYIYGGAYATGTLPSKRFGHVAVAVGGAILAFGGATSSDRAPISELYRINMVVWCRLKPVFASTE
jgi:hypothetical protein